MTKEARLFKTLYAPSAKDKTLAPVHANAGLEAEYRRRLEALIDDMHKSIRYWLLAAYRGDLPDTTELMAIDDSSAVKLDAVMKRLSRYWLRKFKEAGKQLGKHYAQKATDRADNALEHILKNGGLAIKFKMTPAVNDVVQATTKSNVALITNLAQKHLNEIEGLVMRSVQQGRDVGGLAQELEERYKMTRKRARLVARDQNNKATAAIVRTRQAELGIEQAKWLHSHAGKKPRQSHVAMNGKLYDVKEGMWDPDADGKGKGRNVFPGELINCRCVSRSIIPALGVR